MTEIDQGARCDRHVGEVFAPRCADCERANRDAAADELSARHERAQQRAAALTADRPNNAPRIPRRAPMRWRR